jgi:hypothetical protein
MMKKKRVPYSFGEMHVNKYTGTKITEVLDSDRKTAGWIWTLTDGRVVISPNLGFYIWFDEGNSHWTVKSGAIWLTSR